MEASFRLIGGIDTQKVWVLTWPPWLIRETLNAKLELSVRGKSNLAGSETRKAMNEFDASRAILKDKDVFEPFYVKSTRPLREALASGDVHEDTSVLIMDGDSGMLALLTEQMSYHHVAQGEIGGKPWLVSF